MPESYHEPQPPEDSRPPSPSLSHRRNRSGRHAASDAAHANDSCAAAPLLPHEAEADTEAALPAAAARARAGEGWGGWGGARMGAPRNVSRFSTASRFAAAYGLVCVLAVYQTVTALWTGSEHPSTVRGMARLHRAGLLRKSQRGLRQCVARPRESSGQQP